MIKLYKPARSKEHYRGLFSYLSESVINMYNYYELTKPNNIKDIKYFHNLVDIPGYGKGNVFDVIFLQDTEDFNLNKNGYHDIESFENKVNLDCYSPNTFTTDTREKTEIIVKEFFKPNVEFSNLLKSRQNEIDFTKTIGVHRRATDIKEHHKIVDLQELFLNIDSEDFNNIFLMCDNENDTKEFKKRYGNKLITYDDFTSYDECIPFFKLKNDELNIKNHVKELMFGVLTLANTKKFICSRSNLSTFSIITNSKLNYKILL
jgi:hypothetical protein